MNPIPQFKSLPSETHSLPALVGRLAAGCVLLPLLSLGGPLTVSSPDNNITATLIHDEAAGRLTYQVVSQGKEIIAPSPIGIETDHGDFRSGTRAMGSTPSVVDETYTLPQGKASTYRNHANQVELRLAKGDQVLLVRFRAYNDGIAFSFAMNGTGDLKVLGESSAVRLAGRNFNYWGQDHPNNFGYETSLGPIRGERMSNPVLAQLVDQNHFVLIGQAATYGNYVQTHLRRTDSNFEYSFPLDQNGPVITPLPFQSPWRMVIISPATPAKIVESYLVENLNPPTDPALLGPDGKVKEWIKPGRVMWDFIAGDRDQPRRWVDAAADMGWEYYMADAGFANRFGGSNGVREATAYAATKNVGVIGWAHSRAFDTFDKAADTMKHYADMGLKGAKIDFFDHNTFTNPPNRSTRDHEDTQRSLQMRDWIFRLAITNQFLLELHGNTIPTGERRRYPNLMTLEGVNGMEKRQPNPTNDLTIPFIRNVMGPVSYTVIRFSKSPGSHAYQLAMPIVYEAGLMIYAEHFQALLNWPGRELIKDVPSNWDETKFIDGQPGSHVIIARRKGRDWFVGGMTASPRSVNVPLDFLSDKQAYDAVIFRDSTHTNLLRESQSVTSARKLTFNLAPNSGFALRLSPAAGPKSTR